MRKRVVALLLALFLYLFFISAISSSGVAVSPSVLVTGHVVDALSGLPIANASVIVEREIGFD